MNLSQLKSEFKIRNENGILTVNNKNYNLIINDYFAKMSPFESVCLPRTIINENEIEITSKKIDKIINEIFRCRICYEILYEPVTFKSCLHIFCKKCIEDYNRKFKKECVICKRKIETKRLLKKDDRIKQIIDCIIPDFDQFKKEEDKYINNYVKEYFSKKKEKLIQNDNPIKKDEKELNYNNKIKENIEILINNNIINKDVNQCDNNINNINNNETKIKKSIFKINNNNKSYLKRKRNYKKKKEDPLIFENSLNESKNILIKIKYGEKNEKTKFEKTRIKLQDIYSLGFISRFICYKQNLKNEYLKKIDFYTLDSNNKIKEWKDDNTLIKTIVEYDKKHNNKKNELQYINYAFSIPNNCEYILKLFFIFSKKNNNENIKKI